MLEKITGEKIELLPKTPKENEKTCDVCGGIGWLQDKERGFIEKCNNCYSGIIQLCSYCKKPVRGMCMDTDCRNQRDEIAERKRLEKAIRVSYKDAPNESKKMMYSDSYPYNEGYFTDIEDLLEYCKDEDVPAPLYVWSTREINLVMDAWSVVENACDELHESAMDNIDNIKELQNFLNTWCAKQTGTDTYTVDYKYAIDTFN